MPIPKIIAVVSGKGGVGKTMLSVAIANEISAGNRTLMIDLDFFNRGLTGLFASAMTRSTHVDVKPPSIFSSNQQTVIDGTNEKPGWSVVELQRNLAILHYGDLDKDKLDDLEAMDTPALSKILKEYIDAICQQMQFSVVLLDCHGGPDNTSFAACLLADHSILVSEPDRITLHGTLNFLRTLSREAPGASTNIHLVFNKVVPAFSSFFLLNFYRKFLKTEFAGRPLLAAIPLEIYLTKEFERIPFLTNVYPHSQLAEKSRLILLKLFGSSSPILPPAIARTTRSRRLFMDYYMGRWPRILNPDFALKVVAVSAMVVFGGAFVLKELTGRTQDSVLQELGLPQNFMEISIIPMILWFFVTLVLNWTKDLDVYIVYRLRRRSLVFALLLFVMLAVLWSFLSGFLGFAVAEVVHRWNPREEFLNASLIIASIIVALSLAIYFFRGIRSLFVERQFLEGALRVALVAISITWAAMYAR